MEVVKIQMSESKLETKEVMERANKYEENELETEDLWSVIESYFRDQHLKRCVRHQLESYNHFTNNQIQKTIDMFNPVNIHSENDYDPIAKKYALEIIVSFDNFHII